ncbi:hypothetical protein, partial [Escherichia coli]|uniref:hypothetical protein n=1 Tax=Escherichia coli TaxID=562 RepID=UPI001BE4621C
ASFLLKRLNRAVEVPTLASEVFDVPAVSAVKLARQTGICVLTPFAELAGEGGNEYSSRDRNQLGASRRFPAGIAESAIPNGCFV